MGFGGVLGVCFFCSWVGLGAGLFSTVAIAREDFTASKLKVGVANVASALIRTISGCC